MWNGVNALDDVLRVPPSGTWERRRADIYAMAADWLRADRRHRGARVGSLLEHYLGGFGPARLADAANWAGVPAKETEARPTGCGFAASRTSKERSSSTCRARPCRRRTPSRQRASFRSGTRPSSRTHGGRRSSRRSTAPSSSARRRRSPSPPSSSMESSPESGASSGARRRPSCVVEPFEKLARAAATELKEKATGLSASTSRTPRVTRSGSPDQRDAVPHGEHHGDHPLVVANMVVERADRDSWPRPARTRRGRGHSRACCRRRSGLAPKAGEAPPRSS